MKQIIIPLACCAVLGWAGDPWKDKRTSEWTEKDASKVLTNSPWAKTVPAEIAGKPGGSVGVDGGGIRRPPSFGGGSVARGGLIGSGDSPTGGPNGPAAIPTGPQVAVRWETSEPLLDAFSKVDYSLLPRLREWAKEYYVITAAGLPVKTGGQRSGAPPQTDRPQLDPKEMVDRFLQATVLKRKGKDPIVPERVEMIRTGDQMVPMFFFSRKNAISADDKEVTFESSFGPASVKAKFTLKEMLYDGKLTM